jgi:hypothetical protein
LNWTYNADFENSRRDRIRRDIGATGENIRLLTDEELDFCMKEQKYDEFAAAMACEAIAAKYAKYVEKSDLFRHYMQLAKDLQNQGIQRHAQPYFGGTGQEPRFKRGMFDNK